MIQQAKLSRPLHPAWLVAWTSAGVLLGVSVAPIITLPFSVLQLFVVAVSLLVVVFGRRTVVLVGLAVIAGCLLGYARSSVMLASFHSYEAYYGHVVIISGQVAEDVSFGSGGEQHIRLTKVHIDGVSISGMVWISSSTKAEIKRSDRLTFKGMLIEGFGNLPASMHRAALVSAERPVHGDIAREVRDWFADAVRKVVSEPQSSLGIGFLLGQHSSLPEQLSNQLKLLGLTHVVVASGYNLTILVRLARRLFMRISKYAAFVGASGMVVGFVLITGLSPSMSRASLIAGLSLVAWYFGRSIHPLVLLPFSAAITTLLNPSYMWGDIGWYLSFASFAGILLLAPLLKHYFWGQEELGTVNRIVLETMSAQVATLPLIAYVFSQYSPLALPANLLVLPFVPLAMLLTFIVGVVQLVIPFAAHAAALPAEWLLSYMTLITDWLAKLPWAHGSVQFGLPALILGYLALVGIVLLLWRTTKHRFSKDNIVV